MKTKLLLPLIILFYFTTWSQTTVAIPDDAFEAYLEAEFVSNITPDGSTTDGSITFTDINAVQDIDFNTPNVASPTTSVIDLTGIKDFPNLKYLIARANNITGDIDLSGLSKLTKVYIDENSNLTGLNLTGCSSLQQIKASKCNLFSLDLSTVTLNTTNTDALTDVDVDTNNLSVLNITGHTGIDYLDFGFNTNVTSIDISQLTKLTLLRFQECNIIGDIDVSANLSLNTLATYSNSNLTSIDLGAILYSTFTYFKTYSCSSLSCIYTDNPSNFEIGGPLETAIGSNYKVDTSSNFVIDADACALLSTKDFKQFGVSLYPNPTNDKVVVTIEDNVSFNLININGQSLIQGKFNIGNNSLNLSKLSNGLYFLNITTDKGERMIKKLIKQ